MSRNNEKQGMPGSSPYPTQPQPSGNNYAAPPPPYAPVGQQPAAYGYAGTQLPGNQQLYGLPGASGASPMQAPPAYAPPGAPVYHPPQQQQGYPSQQQGGYYPSQTTVVVNNGFDSGARFDGRNAPSIPPPPPGVMPNAAQMAHSQGHNVVVKQQKGGFLSGSGSGAGYTFW